MNPLDDITNLLVKNLNNMKDLIVSKVPNPIFDELDEIEKKALNKPYEKYTNMYNSKGKTYFDPSAYADLRENHDNNTVAFKLVDQINELWQSVKKLNDKMELALRIIKDQDNMIREMSTEFNNKNSEKFIEINDRIEDLESRIDLIDE